MMLTYFFYIAIFTEKLINNVCSSNFMIDIIKHLLMRPGDFFASMYHERGIKDSFVFFGILSFVYTILAGIVGYIVLKTYYADLVVIGFGQYFFIMLLVFLAGLLLSFVSAGILFVWIKIFGGKGVEYDKVYQLTVFSRTPSLIFGWIPLVNTLIWIWSMVLLIIGTMKWFDIQRGKAIFMYVLPLVIFAIVYLLFALFY